MLRRRTIGSKKLVFFQKRFFPAGNYTWIVPPGCTEVDVFLVGAGGGSSFVSNLGPYGGGGGGYTKTFRGKGYIQPATGTWMGTYEEGRDGDAIAVTPGQSIQIIVGAGMTSSDGGYSQFLNLNYRAEGGKTGGSWAKGGDGGSGGSSIINGSTSSNGGSDGSDGLGDKPGIGQNHTTRDFGEPTGKRNAGGGTDIYKLPEAFFIPEGGQSDYVEGTGEYQNFINSNGWHPGFPGGGYGGGGGSSANDDYMRTKGGDGTVLIRYWAYEE